MKVLITGGTGTISSGLVKESVKRGYDTFAITRGNNNSRNIEGANYIHGDIWNSNEIVFLLNEMKFDVVVECLAYNVEQLKISLENFSSKCQQYVFISTAGIYNRVENRRIKETDEKHLIEWDYTKNKIECEEYLKNYSEKTGLKYTIIRPTVTYGDYRIPFPIATRNPGWTFFQRMLDGKPMLASDNVKFSVIHIDDFSEMVVSLFGNNNAINEDFHISSDINDIYWDDVIYKAGELLGTTPAIVHVPVDTIKEIWPSIYDELIYNKNLSLCLDSSKIYKATSVISKINLSDGLTRTYNSMRKEKEQYNSLDLIWDEYCDAVIYFAYKHNQLSATDSLVVDKYIQENTVQNFEVSLKKIKSLNNRKKMRNVLQSLKRNIQNVAKGVKHD